MRTHAQFQWLFTIGVTTSAMVLGFALLVWLRRCLTGRSPGVWRLPWEAAVLAVVLAGMWWDHWEAALIVFLPMVGGVVAIVLLVVAAVALLRRGSDIFLLPAIWLVALLLLPTLYVAAALTDNVVQLCF